MVNRKNFDLVFAIETEKTDCGFYFVYADTRLENGDYVYKGKRYTAVSSEDTIVTYREVIE